MSVQISHGSTRRAKWLREQAEIERLRTDMALADVQVRVFCRELGCAATVSRFGTSCDLCLSGGGPRRLPFVPEQGNNAGSEHRF